MMAWEWMDVECENKKDVMIIDLGYLGDEKARNRADRFIESEIGKKNIILFPSPGVPRIHIKIPKTKQKMILNRFSVKKIKTYFGANYSYLHDE